MIKLPTGSKVKITVTNILGKGTCPAYLKVGDSWEVHSEILPERFCSWAFQSIYPFITVLRFGGSFPWGDKENEISVCCPDPANPVVFRLERFE
ncbi:MAG: TIGR04076 family protein [Actinomycetota bacterium]|nr:TIGR04076 family protein [Actinomycetota bacterium]